jgi:Tol biopolymer transport system component
MPQGYILACAIRRIAFDSILNGQWEVFVTSVSGGKPKPIASNPASDWLPTWSGDGKWIYFASNRAVARMKFGK